MLKSICFCLVVVAVVVLSGCSSDRAPEAPPAVTEIVSPAGMGSEEPNLSVAPDGRVFLTWLEPASPEGYKLMFSIRDVKGAWSPPRMVAGGVNWFVNDADFPSMTVLSDGSLAAHWLGNNEPGTEAYDVNISISHDGAQRGASLSLLTATRRKASTDSYRSFREPAHASMRSGSMAERQMKKVKGTWP